MAQTSITNYFNKRKRPIDDIKAKTKVMVLDQELFSCTESIKAENNCDANIVFKNTHEFPHSVRSSASIRSDVKQHKMVSFDLPEIKAPKNYADKGKKVTKVTSSPGYDIRETFRKSSSSIKLAVDSVCSDSREVVLHEKSKLTSQETFSISSVNEKVNGNECVFVITEGTKAKPNVPFEQLGSLSPYKNTSTQSQPTNNVTLSDYALNEAQDLDKQAKIGNPNRTNDARKELGLMSPTKSFPRKCKLAFCKTIADECQPFLQRFQTSKPMTPYLFEAVEKLLRYLMNRCVKPDLMKCTGPKLLSIDTKKSENLILSKNIDIGFATKRLLGETAITVTERQKLEFIHECRSMLTTMIAKLQEKSPLKQKAVRGLSSLDPCVIQHSPQLAQKRFSFLLEELNHANIINDVLAENAKKEYLHFCNLKKSELQEIFRPCDQFSDEVGLDTIYGSFLIGEANYKHLWEVIKICLVLSHGNATVEGGFSVNKSLLVENMHEKTVIAQRHIHDEIQEAGGIKNIHISKKMLDYVRGARKRYHEYLEMKKQEKSEKDKKKAEKRKLDIQVKDLEGERKKLMMATEEKREAIDVELQELKKKQASLY
uniref:Uncharacterized protein n=1 Tax=Timema monikensis TaxID=170555 RepID=A0A7R9EHI2_9NEOP|nr:unnamed protein product [Timema monikensis]